MPVPPTKLATSPPSVSVEPLPSTRSVPLRPFADRSFAVTSLPNRTASVAPV